MVQQQYLLREHLMLASIPELDDETVSRARLTVAALGSREGADPESVATVLAALGLLSSPSVGVQVPS